MGQGINNPAQSLCYFFGGLLPRPPPDGMLGFLLGAFSSFVAIFISNPGMYGRAHPAGAPRSSSGSSLGSRCDRLAGSGGQAALQIMARGSDAGFPPGRWLECPIRYLFDQVEAIPRSPLKLLPAGL